MQPQATAANAAVMMSFFMFESSLLAFVFLPS
jgi:hypothetical protein